MARNTKEISLIQHRTGKLSEMPKALNQSEIGVAYDEGRVFIGNAKNTILANRTVFPYQNLEILTEFSNLNDHFKYSYENNITESNGITDRLKLKEYLPIAIIYPNTVSTIEASGHITINTEVIELTGGIENPDTIEDVVNKINAVANTTKVFASIINTKLTLLSTCGEFSAEFDSTNAVKFGEPIIPTSSSDMPERKISEKMDDFLNITDFGIKGDGKTNYSKEIYESLIEVYKKYDDAQYFRNVFFPAGTYIFGTKTLDNNITYNLPFPIISNLHVHGEGIDRTIISNDSLYTLLNCVDDDTNIETSSNYGGGNYPNNILIEDMTFESNSETLCKLKSVSNITFNRVKFKSTSAIKLVDIIGSNNNYANNITFNECIFEGGIYGIFAETFAENITITNCLFDTIDRCAIKLGDDAFNENALIKAININGNIIKNSPIHWDSSSGYAIEICRNVKWASIHQTQFDERLFTNWKTNTFPRPCFRSALLVNDTNFVDILDPTTDEKKILGFHFTQPDWRYLNYLVNTVGKTVLGIDVTDNDIDSLNGLNIISNDNGDLDIRAVGTTPGDVKLSVNNNSDIILGAGTLASTIYGNIQLKKTLQLNDNKISNENGTGDITFKTSPDGLLVIEDNKLNVHSDNYERRIDNEPNAIPNVAFVKNATSLAFEKIITYKDLNNFENGSLNILHFDTTKYGDNVHLKRITIGARIPFYKSFEDISKAVGYLNGYRYYAGDVVQGNVDSTTTYAVVLNTHTATSYDIVGNDNLQIIPNENYKSIKYVELVGFTDAFYPLTNTYYENYNNPDASDTYNMIDIQSNNKFGYNNCTKFTSNYVMPENVDHPLVEYCDRIYVLDKDATYHTANDLHKIVEGYRPALNANRKYDEGYTYIFELDKNYNFKAFDLGGAENPATVNFANGDILLKFYDEDKNLIRRLDDITQLNPAGKLLVRIEFIRDEV